MKCVVTGASGHIGNVLVRELVKQNYEVTAFVLQGEEVSYLKELGVTIIYGNVLDKKSLVQAFRGTELVFHLAGIIEIGNKNKKRMYRSQCRRN